MIFVPPHGNMHLSASHRLCSIGMAPCHRACKAWHAVPAGRPGLRARSGMQLAWCGDRRRHAGWPVPRAGCDSWLGVETGGVLLAGRSHVPGAALWVAWHPVTTFAWLPVTGHAWHGTLCPRDSQVCGRAAACSWLGVETGGVMLAGRSHVPGATFSTVDRQTELWSQSRVQCTLVLVAGRAGPPRVLRLMAGPLVSEMASPCRSYFRCGSGVGQPHCGELVDAVFHCRISAVASGVCACRRLGS